MTRKAAFLHGFRASRRRDAASSGGAWGNLFGTVAEEQTWPSLGMVTVTLRKDSGITLSGQASAVCVIG